MVNSGLDIFFATRKDSQKVNQVNNNPEVILYFQVPNQTIEEFRSVIITGKASPLSDEKEFNGVLDKLGQKSPEYKNYINRDGFEVWSIYKVSAYTLQYTDFTKSKKTIRQDI